MSFLGRLCQKPRTQRSSDLHKPWRSYTTYGFGRHTLPLAPLRGTKPNILIVKKIGDERVTKACGGIIEHLKTRYPEANVLIEPTNPTSKPFCERGPDSCESSINLVITLGGDGTILHASKLFRGGPVPPVLSFSLGTLGFLLPFHIGSFAEALEEVFDGKLSVLPRMRLACGFRDSQGSVLQDSATAGYQLMNEVTLHRGRNTHLTVINAFVDEQHLTEAVSDGLIVSTPTGSTAYSLSSGGPIVHPSMHALLLTPICPRSLSFRPLLFPSSSRLTLKVSEKSRAPAEVSMDGQDVRLLHPGESVVVESSPFPIPCINRVRRNPRGTLGEQDGWVQDINRLLHFNTSFKPVSISDPDP